VSEQNNGKQAEEPKAIDQAPVKQALEMIRPYLQADGGDVELVSVEPEGVVKVRLVGACGGCPMSQITLSAGIERILKQQVPAVKRVEAV
jgi:Fe-S cluster biogenesis protein NfuA